MKNNPADWRRREPVHPDNADVIMEMNSTYPRDGRETVYPPYEQYAPTRTVGEYRSALAAVDADPASFPDDFRAYLEQRVPSLQILAAADPDTGIDAYGKLVGPLTLEKMLMLPTDPQLARWYTKTLFSDPEDKRTLGDLVKADYLQRVDADDLTVKPCAEGDVDACAEENCAYAKPHKHANTNSADVEPAGVDTNVTTGMP